MIWFIVVFVWMNIGIAWGLHRGDADWSEVDEKVFVQIHMVLWPVSMAVNFGHDFYLWNIRRRIARLKAKEGQAHRTTGQSGH